MAVIALFVVLLFIGVPIALVLAVSAMGYIELSDNSVLFLSYPQQFGSSQTGVKAK